MTDYDRIEAAMAFLETHRLSQPTLEEVAAHIGLSKYHFQKLFQRWAGVSPKTFLGYLTASHARKLLESGVPTLETAYSVGLSGTGRLHDLFIKLEAATPGEIKSRGEGMAIRYGMCETPFGRAFVARTLRGLCRLEFGVEMSEALASLQKTWPRATYEGPAEIANPFENWASGNRDAIQLYVKGTPFQVQVWRALLRIPEGTITSYGQLATSMGMAGGAARAVGSAVGKNDIGILIPCHRVIRRMGEISDYRWGPARKKAVLGWEQARIVGE